MEIKKIGLVGGTGPVPVWSAFPGRFAGRRSAADIRGSVFLELPLLLNSGNCPVPCLDSVEIHIEELIRQAIPS